MLCGLWSLVSFAHCSVVKAQCVVVSVGISFRSPPDHMVLCGYPLINARNNAAMSFLHVNLGESMGSFMSAGWVPVSGIRS